MSEPPKTPEIDLSTLESSARTVVQYGIILPWTWHNPYEPDDESAWRGGEVFIRSTTLDKLCEQGATDSMFDSPLLLHFDEGLALEQAGLAVKETRGGYHGNDAIKTLCRRLGWY